MGCLRERLPTHPEDHIHRLEDHDECPEQQHIDVLCCAVRIVSLVALGRVSLCLFVTMGS